MEVNEIREHLFGLNVSHILTLTLLFTPTGVPYYSISLCSFSVTSKCHCFDHQLAMELVIKDLIYLYKALRGCYKHL